MQAKNLTHTKIMVGVMPIIDQVLAALGFADIAQRFLGNMRYAKVLEALVKSILVEPAALYRVPEWVAAYEREDSDSSRVTDDVIRRTLDKLFNCDRATFQTELTVKTVQEYEVDTSQVHNDSTTVKFYGAYKRQSAKAAQLKRGHSKDHRPDLKQLVYNLSIAADGAIPVHFKCHDGNRTDDTLHIETWLTLRGILKRADFLYVADAKLCTSENMKKIDREGGRFVTVVPQTRAETDEFAISCYESGVRWSPLTRRKSTRKHDTYDVFQIADGLFQLREGFCLYWYRSSEKRKRDKDSREERIGFALDKLDDLQTQRRRGPKSENTLLKAAQKILARYNVGQWIDLQVRSREVEEFKKDSPGKPTPDATYRRKVKKVPYLVVNKNYEAIARSEAIDGTFPLTTNTKLNAKEVLQAYKYQPYIEKRFSWTKSDYQVAPVFLKKTERIEALMFACYLADLVAAIVQRQLRIAMKLQKIEEIQTLPENRPSKTPTWEQIQRLFANQAKYQIGDNNGKLVATFWDELSNAQAQVLNLLQVPLRYYAD